MENAQLSAVLAALSNHVKEPLADHHTGVLIGQPTGLWSSAVTDNNVVSTHVVPMGLGSVLPAYPSNLDNPLYPVFVGWTGARGTKPDGPCDPSTTVIPQAGKLTAAWGRTSADTNTIEIDTTLHQTRDAGNLNFLGTSVGENTLIAGQFAQNPLATVVQTEMIGIGVQLERELATLIWQGDPANNTARGGYKEFPGLDLQIATGHIDAESGVALPSVDSLIVNFDDFVDSDSKDIVQYVAYMDHYLSNLARRTGMAPVEWVFVMRPELWFELTMIWVCRYLTSRCDNNTGAGVSIIGSEMVRMRDELRNGLVLTINGVRRRVILDDGIRELDSGDGGGLTAGQFSSSIYWIPISARGGTIPLTFWQYIDYRRVPLQTAAMGAAASKLPFWSDGGRLLWTMEWLRYCFLLSAKIEPRIIMRAPHLAAKLQGVRYTPMIRTRDWNPDSPYWVGGGVSLRPYVQDQAVWMP